MLSSPRREGSDGERDGEKVEAFSSVTRPKLPRGAEESEGDGFSPRVKNLRRKCLSSRGKEAAEKGDSLPLSHTDRVSHAKKEREGEYVLLPRQLNDV